MEITEPYHDDEAQGVLFEVAIDGQCAQGYISCVLLSLLCQHAATPEEWVEVYRRHRSLIDAVVARRAPAEGWDTVMVRRSDLTPPA